MFGISWNRVRIGSLFTGTGGVQGGDRLVRLLGLSTVLLLLLSLGLHFGTQYAPGDFLASEEDRLVEQVARQRQAFDAWVSLCEEGPVSELGQWGSAAKQAGLPEWQLQVFMDDSLMYWSQSRLTASEIRCMILSTPARSNESLRGRGAIELVPLTSKIALADV